ncbi:MAG: alpha/beta hydrolase [Opitutaceae bacterium]|nr:alpha/beta hydrolase [Opitutaceae bacterium]
MRTPGFLRLVPLLLAGVVAGFGQAASAISPEQLKAWLKQYPDADTNKDGVLSEEEAHAYYARMQAAASKAPPPTLENVPYGPKPRQVFDLWRAPGDRPTGLVIYFYGGGFVSGDKAAVRSMRLVPQCLAAGVSVASVNSRFLSSEVSLRDVLGDAARAVQFLRSRAEEYHLDKTRFAACGNSAGAGTSLWLAFHEDLADPANVDPVLRESTRLVGAVSWDGQYTYDLPQWGGQLGEENRRRFGGIYNSPGLYGLKTEAELMGPIGQRLRAECDFYAMISPDDPPVYVGCGLPNADLTNVNQYLHHPRHSLLVVERCRSVGVPVVAKIPALKVMPAEGEPAHGEPFLFKVLAVAAKPAAPVR